MFDRLHITPKDGWEEDSQWEEGEDEDGEDVSEEEIFGEDDEEELEDVDDNDGDFFIDDLKKAVWRDEDGYPDPASLDLFSWIDDQLEVAKQRDSTLESAFPFQAGVIGRGIELRLSGTFQDAINSYLEGLTGNETEEEIFNGIGDVVDQWVALNLQPVDQVFDNLFRSGFMAGQISVGGALGEWDESRLEMVSNGRYRIGNRIKVFGDNLVKQFSKIITEAFRPGARFELAKFVEDMGEVAPANRYQLERIGRTEVSQVSQLGRLARFAEDPDRYFFDYFWRSTPDARRRAMKVERTAGNPYTYNEIVFLWTHNWQKSLSARTRSNPDGWQMGAINCRCTVTRRPRVSNDESRGDRFAGRESDFRKSVDYDTSMLV